MPQGDILLHRAHCEGVEFRREDFIGLPGNSDEPAPMRGFMWHPDPEWGHRVITAFHQCGGEATVMTVVTHPFTMSEVMDGVRQGYISPDALELLPDPEVEIVLPLSQAEALYDCACVGVDAGPHYDSVQGERLRLAYEGAQELASACRRVQDERARGLS